jgi:hypothetical protein
VGLVRGGNLKGNRLEVRSSLRIFGAYGGVTVCDRSFRPVATVARATGDSLELAAPPTGRISPGDDLWLVDAAVGETVRAAGIASWTTR